jgi:hypothetical protein
MFARNRQLQGTSQSASRTLRSGMSKLNEKFYRLSLLLIPNLRCCFFRIMRDN